MAQTTAPSETPDDSRSTSGNSEGSTAAPTEQGTLSSSSLGRLKMALPPSAQAAGDGIHEPQPATNPEPQAAIEAAKLSGQEAPEAIAPPGERPGDGLRALPPSSGRVTLPRPASITQIPVSDWRRDEADEPLETAASSPTPSQTLTGSGRTPASGNPSLPSPSQAFTATSPGQPAATPGPSSPALPSPTPGFTLAPEDLKRDVPLGTAAANREAVATSVMEETIDLPKATGPLEAPPLIVTEPGAATTFLPDVAEEAPLANAITKLQGACRELVDRVYKIRAMKSGLQIISALVDVVNDLDTRYAADTGMTRRDGMEDLLVEVRRSVAEGDRFILESLENGRGGLSVASFERDLKTIARGDQPRILMAYATFLVFIISRELQRYLRPLEKDEWRRREVVARLNYLLDGVRDVLLARLTNARANK